MLPWLFLHNYSKKQTSSACWPLPRTPLQHRSKLYWTAEKRGMLGNGHYCCIGGKLRYLYVIYVPRGGSWFVFSSSSKLISWNRRTVPFDWSSNRFHCFGVSPIFSCRIMRTSLKIKKKMVSTIQTIIMLYSKACTVRKHTLKSHFLFPVPTIDSWGSLKNWWEGMGETNLNSDVPFIFLEKYANETSKQTTRVEFAMVHLNFESSLHIPVSYSFLSCPIIGSSSCWISRKYEKIR